MSAPAYVSPFRAAGIEIVPQHRQPLRPQVGRRPFPILDLRDRDEADYEQLLPGQTFARNRAFLEAAYAAEAVMKADPLFRAEGAAVFRGIWIGGQPVAGSVMARQPADLAAFQERLQRLIQRGTLPRLPGTTAVISGPGERNYFHWTTEVCPRLFALRDHVRQGGRLDRVLLFHKDAAPYVREVAEIFFPDLAPLLQPAESAMCLLEEALFFVDQRFLERRIPSEDGGVPHNTRFKPPTLFLSEAVDALLDSLPRGPGRALLVSRQDAPTRRIVNEDALLDALAEHGLERVTFSGVPVRRQIEAMADARLVVGAHGAGLTNILYCRPGTAVIEITTSQYMRRCRSFADIAMHRGLPYALVVVDQHGERWRIQQNRGNDMEIAPRGGTAIRDLARQLLAGGAQPPLAGAA